MPPFCAIPPLLPVVLLLASLVAAPRAAADTVRVDDETQAAAARALAAYARPVDAAWADSVATWAWHDVTGDGVPDALALLRSAAWCGSGGCTVVVLEAVVGEDADELGPFAVAAEIAYVHTPVWLSERRSNGWCDLVTEDVEGTLRRLRFDGETYPYSPAAGAPAGGTEARTVVFG